MAATDPVTPKPRHFSIRLPRPLWIGVAAVVLIVVAAALRVGLPTYREQVAIRAIRQLGGRVHTKPGGPDWLRHRIGDERMEPFDHAEWVDLEHRKFADADLRALRQLPQLRVLLLGRTEITDDGLAHLAGLPRLQKIDLRVTRVSDVGLVHLRALRNLKVINLAYTKVTENGVTALEKAVPSLLVAWGVSYDRLPPPSNGNAY